MQSRVREHQGWSQVEREREGEKEKEMEREGGIERETGMGELAKQL